MDCNFDIIIIGCGAVSVSFLYQLNEQALLTNKKLKIAIFDQSNKAPSGYAYSCEGQMLLNTRVEEIEHNLIFENNLYTLIQKKKTCHI